MLGAIVLTGLAVAVLAGMKKSSVSGVGAVKRRIYSEIAEAQKHGVLFDRGYDEQDEKAKRYLNSGRFRWKQTASSAASGKSYADAYFNNLRRGYKAIAGIGATSLPYTESFIYNDEGDEIMRYRDYGSDADKMRDAIRHMEELASNPNNIQSMVYRTILGIASGSVKFVWSTPKGKDGVLKGVNEELFGGGSHPKEKKLYKSILGKWGNEGVYTPAGYAHHLYREEYGADDRDALNAVNDALMTVNSVTDAKKYIMDVYMEDMREQHEQYTDYDMPANDLPF